MGMLRDTGVTMRDNGVTLGSLRDTGVTLRGNGVTLGSDWGHWETLGSH